MYKKLFTLLLVSIFIMSVSAVSASDFDLDDSLASDANYDSDYNSDVSIAASNTDSNVLSDDKTPSKITVVSNTSGLIEEDKFELSVRLTDENDIPIEGDVYIYYSNNTLPEYGKHSTDGFFNFDITEDSSGFYYYKFEYLGNALYSPYTTDYVELAFANDNTLTDLAVRVELSDGILNLTKDFEGYGKNIERRNVSNYGQVLNSYKINNGIPIVQNIIINGNNHTFDALKKENFRRSFFTVNRGCALTINDMTLTNGYTVGGTDYMFYLYATAALNLYNVTIKNSYSSSSSIFGPEGAGYSLDIKDSSFINNSVEKIFDKILYDTNVERCLFLNNSNNFNVWSWISVTFSYNLFINTSTHFNYWDDFGWDGCVKGNYWGTNNLDYIYSNIISYPESEMLEDYGHSFLTISGNNSFCEDYDQDYDIYFSGDYADKLPTYSTIITYISNCSTINATEINISSSPTTFRVSPKTYGNATLIVEPGLYEYDINITKSTRKDYNVTVSAPEAGYTLPFEVTVTVYDADNNPVTTTANITIDGTTHTIDVNNGVGVLTLNDLNPGTYEIKTKIISEIDEYRNTTIYSQANITKSKPAIAISCNTTVTLAREDIVISINTKNSNGDNVSALVFIEEDGIEVGNITTDDDGNAVFHFSPEAGNHRYVAKTHDEFWELSQSNAVEVEVINKAPTKMSISIDKQYITEEDDYVTIIVKLLDENNSPISNADIDLIVNGDVADSNITDSNGECEFKFTNSSGIYKIKAVYCGNLTYYDNFTETMTVTITTGGNFRDLAFLINCTDENSALDIVRNYTYDESVDSEFVRGIPINKNIIINGLNNTINGLNKSRIFNIDAREVHIDNLNFINANSYTAGAILYNGNKLYVSNSNFENNLVYLSLESINYGDSSYYGGGAIYSNGELYIDNTRFYNNSVIAEEGVKPKSVRTIGGGAIYSNSSLYINNSVFDLNKVNKTAIGAINLLGSAIYVNKGIVTIDNSIFNNSYASAEACVYVNHLSDGITILNSIFSNSTALNYAALYSLSNHTFIINSTFINNHASDAGAVHIFTSKGDSKISESRFINNSARNGGAILMGQGTNLTIEKSSFVNNTATDGGAIYRDVSSTLFASYNIFVNNIADNATCIYVNYEELDDNEDNSTCDYNYWGTNDPLNSNVFNNNTLTSEYITLEVIGDNVTYTTIPTDYVVKFNGTNSDKLPVFETQMIIACGNGTVTKEDVVIDSTGKEFVLTSNTVQNITVALGPEYNNLTVYNITVEQLIRKNYTANIISIINNTYGEKTIIKISITDVDGETVNGTASYICENNNGNINLVDGTGVIELPRSFDAGNHSITINYNTSDIHYNNLTEVKTFEILKAQNEFQINVHNATYGESNPIIIVPQTGANGNYTFFIENVLNVTNTTLEYNKTNSIPVGNYTLIVTYGGNNNYYPNSLNTSFSVSKANSTISIKVGEVRENENVNIVFSVSKGATGEITIEIPGLYTPRNRTLTAASYVWSISPLDHGMYTVNAYYPGDNNYYSSSNSTVIDFRYKANLDVDAKVMGSKLRLSANLTGANGDLINGTVNVSVNNKNYIIDVVNGAGHMDIERLDDGNYSYTASYAGDDKFSNITTNGVFEVQTPDIIIDIPEVVKYFSGPERLYVYVKDTNGNPIADKKVTVFLNNKQYTRTTNANGSVNLPLGLSPGNYEVIAVVDALEGAGKVNILTTVNGLDITKMFKNATRYYATFYNADGNPIPEGTPVTFNINGVIYTRKVNSEGVASLNINLPPGEYTITGHNPITNEDNSNTVTVLPKIVENKDVTKYFANATQYTVKVLDDHGNPVGAGEAVRFNINGVFYTRKTDENGIAKLAINLPPGDYIITAEYDGASVSNNIKVLPTLSADNLTKQYGTSTPFVAKLLDGQGKPYAGQIVTFNINGVFYKRTTDVNGQAKLNISLPPGSYIITSTYGGLNIANNVTVS